MSVYSRTETIGRVYLEGPGDLAHRLVRLEPVDAVLAADHELAGRDALRPGSPRWLEYRPGADWLPDTDQAEARAATARQGT